MKSRATRNAGLFLPLPNSSSLTLALHPIVLAFLRASDRVGWGCVKREKCEDSVPIRFYFEREAMLDLGILFWGEEEWRLCHLVVPLNYLDSQNWKLLCSELFSFVYLVCFLCSTRCLSCLTLAHELAGLLLCLEVQGCAKELTR